jgi:catechol 2,3-dioxygenase-like lactoylglutathione lyase family enzyme
VNVGHFEIFVTDPLAAREFYERVLGFAVTNVQGEQFVWLTSGESVFLLRPGRTAGAAASYRETRTAIVLYTSDLTEAVAELKERGVEFAGTDGSDKCPTFRDPDGNWFQLVNPSDH